MKSLPRLSSSVVLVIGAFAAGLAGLTDAGQVFAQMEYHVSIQGDDANPGSMEKPLKTISAAAEHAQPGDTITVHEGVYRERITPPRGGESDARRITYQAAAGERVEIKGSEIIQGWEHVQHDTWKVVLPNTFFGAFNPYADRIQGDWFEGKGRAHHTGAVYLNGDWLMEAVNVEDVLEPVGEIPWWFAEVGDESTTIWAQFRGADPNEALVEINVRQAVFYPDAPGRNYITVRGFIMRHAATPWAPPTAEQVGLLGTHWSKGWIIESNEISHSKCTGITLGKYGDAWDNTSANTAEGYVLTIERALATGWSSENIGHHLVRNNTISHCEQAGLVGSMGAVFSVITGNTIHDIHVQRLFTGAEMAGIKIHGAIDMEISRNRIYRTARGIWLDWMAQGARVTGNLLYENASEDLFMEVNHGPYLVDNNLLLSDRALLDMSQGGAYAHNLIAGAMVQRAELSRATPYHRPHSTELAGLQVIEGGDNRFYNNIFVRHNGLIEYDTAALPGQMSGNVFLHGALPSAQEQDAVVRADLDPKMELREEQHGVRLQVALEEDWWSGQHHALVTTALLGEAKIPGLPYVNPDTSSIRINTDYFGEKRDEQHPTPGPFARAPGGVRELRVWPHGKGAGAP